MDQAYEYPVTPTASTRSLTRPSRRDDKTQPSLRRGIHYGQQMLDLLQRDFQSLAIILGYTTAELSQIAASLSETLKHYISFTVPDIYKSVTLDTLLAAAVNPKWWRYTIHHDTLSKCPRGPRPNMDPATFPHMITLWFIRRMIMERPAVFPRSCFMHTNQEMHPLDVFHAWCLMNFVRNAYTRPWLGDEQVLGRERPVAFLADLSEAELRGFLAAEAIIYGDGVDQALATAPEPGHRIDREAERHHGLGTA